MEAEPGVRQGLWPALGSAAAFLVVWAGLNAVANLATPGRDPGPGVWYLLPSVDVTVLLLAFAVLGWRGVAVPRLGIAVLTVLLLAIRLYRAGEGLIQLNYYRPLNLYLDLPLLPDLGHLLSTTVKAPTLALGVVAVLLGVAGLSGLVAAALSFAQRALARRLNRLVLIAGVALAAALSPVLWPGHDSHHLGLFGQSVAPHVAEQIRYALAAEKLRQSKSSAIAHTQAELQHTPVGLGRLQRADVFIFFIESYGSTVLHKPAFWKRMQPAYDAFAGEMQRQGLSVVSSLLDSSTYGGGSWLAHATFAAGVSIKDGLEFAVLRQTDPAPRTQATFFARAGYRTVLVQPGTTRTWPEGEVSGFTAKYYAPAFDYRGPRFGWATMPDQYVLDFVHRREVEPATQPLFIEYALVSSHAPWDTQVAVLDDWSRIGDGRIFQTLPTTAYPTTWQNLGQAGEAYMASLIYDFTVLQQYIARNAQRPALFVVLGDHQPPGNLTNNDPSPAVPVHLISRDAALLDSFAADGYAAGMVPPPTGAAAGMETFLTTFVGRLSAAP